MSEQSKELSAKDTGDLHFIALHWEGLVAWHLLEVMAIELWGRLSWVLLNGYDFGRGDSHRSLPFIQSVVVEQIDSGLASLTCGNIDWLCPLSYSKMSIVCFLMARGFELIFNGAFILRYPLYHIKLVYQLHKVVQSDLFGTTAVHSTRRIARSSGGYAPGPFPTDLERPIYIYGATASSINSTPL